MGGECAVPVESAVVRAALMESEMAATSAVRKGVWTAAEKVASKGGLSAVGKVERLVDLMVADSDVMWVGLRDASLVAEKVASMDALQAVVMVQRRVVRWVVH